MRDKVEGNRKRTYIIGGLSGGVGETGGRLVKRCGFDLKKVLRLSYSRGNSFEKLRRTNKNSVSDFRRPPGVRDVRPQDGWKGRCRVW